MDTATKIDVDSLLLVYSKEDLITVFTNRFNKHAQEHQEVFRVADQLHAVICQLKGIPASSPNGVDQRGSTEDSKRVNYSRSWTWIDKIVFKLKKVHRPLSFVEIVDLLATQEKTDPSNIKNSISSALATCKKRGTLVVEELNGLAHYKINDGTHKAAAKQIPAATGPTTISPDGYDEQWGWFEKIDFFLRDAVNGLATKEIADLIAQRERLSIEERNKAYNSLSARLSQGLKEGKYKKQFNLDKGSNDYSLKIGTKR